MCMCFFYKKIRLLFVCKTWQPLNLIITVSLLILFIIDFPSITSPPQPTLSEICEPSFFRDYICYDKNNPPLGRKFPSLPSPLEKTGGDTPPLSVATRGWGRKWGAGWLRPEPAPPHSPTQPSWRNGGGSRALRCGHSRSGAHGQQRPGERLLGESQPRGSVPLPLVPQ